MDSGCRKHEKCSAAVQRKKVSQPNHAIEPNKIDYVFWSIRRISAKGASARLPAQASLEQTVAAMRFFLAHQSASTWQGQGPLTEEDFLARLHEWATTPAAASRCMALLSIGHTSRLNTSSILICKLLVTGIKQPA